MGCGASKEFGGPEPRSPEIDSAVPSALPSVDRNASTLERDVVVAELESARKQIALLQEQLSASEATTRQLTTELESFQRNRAQSEVAKGKNTGDELERMRSQLATSFLRLFERIDRKKQGWITLSELEDSLRQVSPLELAESEKLRELRTRASQTAAGSADTISFSDFQQIVSDLYSRKYRSLCHAVSFSDSLHRSLLRALLAGELHGEGDSMLALSGFLAAEPRARAALLLEHCLAVLPEVVLGLVLAVGAEEEYREQDDAIPDAEGKFKHMILCPEGLFSQGLEKVIGFPVYSSDESILEAMEAEHTVGKLSMAVFAAWNHGTERKTTPREQWQLLMPSGRHGDIYGSDYSGNAPAIDFMQHEKVVKSGMKKHEVIGLRLYSGPMFHCYNSHLRRLGQSFEKFVPLVAGELASLKSAFSREASQACRQDATAAVAALDAEVAVARERCRSSQVFDGSDNSLRHGGDRGGADGNAFATEEGVGSHLVTLWGKGTRPVIDSLERTVTFTDFWSVAYMLESPPGGKVYYELTVLEELDCPQFGFATKAFVFAADRRRGQGVGDDADSWAVDGARRKLWHLKQSFFWGEEWRIGDVVGLACDLQKRQIMVSRNGDFSAPRGKVFDLPQEACQGGLFAAFSASGGAVRFNFGERNQPFRNAPPSEAYTPFVAAAGADSAASLSSALELFSTQRFWGRVKSGFFRDQPEQLQALRTWMEAVDESAKRRVEAIVEALAGLLDDALSREAAAAVLQTVARSDQGPWLAGLQEAAEAVSLCGGILTAGDSAALLGGISPQSPPAAGLLHTAQALHRATYVAYGELPAFGGNSGLISLGDARSIFLAVASGEVAAVPELGVAARALVLGLWCDREAATQAFKDIARGERKLPPGLAEATITIKTAIEAKWVGGDWQRPWVGVEPLSKLFAGMARGEVATPPRELFGLCKPIADALEAQLIAKDEAVDMVMMLLRGECNGEHCWEHVFGSINAKLAARESFLQEEAMKRAQNEVGIFQYVTTVHAISSALIKVSRITPLPKGAKVFRGMAGVKPSRRLLEPNEFGSRVGNELAFMSTSTDKDQAIGYLNAGKRYKQMFEIEVGHVDHGADIDFLSLFPGEKEMLFPPNSCLEVLGAPRYECSHKGLVKVWSLRLNVQLKSKTLEEFQATRKALLLEAAAGGLHDVELMGAEHQARIKAEAQAEPEKVQRRLQNAKELFAGIQREVAGDIEVMARRPAEFYNNDVRYKLAYEQVTDIKPLAAGVVELWQMDRIHYFSSNLVAARQQLVQILMQDLEACNAAPEPDASQGREVAGRLCRLKKLLAMSLEERDSQDFTPVMHWAAEGYSLAVHLLLQAGADPRACTPDGSTALHLAADANHVQVVQAWGRAGAPADMADRAGRTAVHVCVERGHLDCVAALAEANACLDAKHRFTGYPGLEKAAPVHAAVHGGNLQLLRVLKEAGADIRALDDGGFTAMHRAAQDARVDVMQMLWEWSAPLDVDAAVGGGKKGCTPLHLAVAKNHLPAVQFLVEHGANVHAVFALGQNFPRLEGPAGESGSALDLAYAAHGEQGMEVGEYLESKGAIAHQHGRPVAWATGVHRAAQQGSEEDVKRLVEQGADVNGVNAGGFRPVHCAVAGGQLEMVKLLAQLGADLSALVEGNKTHGGKSCLDLALALNPCSGAKDTEIPMALFLESHGVRAHQEQRGLWLLASAVHLAAAHGTKEQLLSVLSHAADAEGTEPAASSPLHAAADSGNLGTLEVLIDRGYDLDARNEYQQTAAMVAVSCGRLEALKVLAQQGADLHAEAEDDQLGRHTCLDLVFDNEQNHRGDTQKHFEVAFFLEVKGVKALARRRPRNWPSAFLAAAQRGNDEALRELVLQRGQDVNAVHSGGYSAVHLAVAGRQVKTVRSLKELGADLHAAVGSSNPSGHAGWTSLDLAVSRREFVAEDRQLVLLLDAEGVHCCRPRPSELGATPLHLASAEGDAERVRSLLEMRADVQASSTDGTALHMAAQGNHLEVARLLVEQGSDLEATSADGRTALLCSAGSGSMGVTRALLESKADHTARDRKGFTAVLAAVRSGHVAVLELLLANEAAMHDVVGAGSDEDGRLSLAGSKPVHLAAMMGHVGVLECLHNRGADLTAVVDRSVLASEVISQSLEGHGVVHCAAMGGHILMLDWLHEHGLDLHARVGAVTGSTQVGWSVVHAAVQSANAGAVLEHLHSKGVDLHATVTHDGELWSALDYAYSNAADAAGRFLEERGVLAHAVLRPAAWDSGLHAAARNNDVGAIRQLCRDGVDVDERDPAGLTAVHAAALGGSALAVEALESLGADLHAVVDGEGAQAGKNAVHFVVEGSSIVSAAADHEPAANGTAGSGNSDSNSIGERDMLLRLLCARGLDIEKVCRRGYRPVHLVKDGGVRLLELLEECGADMRVAVAGSGLHQGYSALDLAYRAKSRHVAEFLEARRVRAGHVSRAECSDVPRLQAAATRNDVVAAARVLLEGNEDVSGTDARGYTALHCAAEQGHVHMLEFLLDRGASVHSEVAGTGSTEEWFHKGRASNFSQYTMLVRESGQPNAGCTAVHLAAASGHLAAVRLLHDRGADLHKTVPGHGRHAGRNALGIACRLTTGGESKLFSPTAVAKQRDVRRGREVGLYLEGLGMEVAKGGRPKEWGEGLHAVAQIGDAEGARRLCEGGADVNARDATGNTPLHVAVLQGHRAVVELLVGCGADVNASVEQRCVLHLVRRMEAEAQGAGRGEWRALALFLEAKGAIMEPDYDRPSEWERGLLAAAVLADTALMRQLEEEGADLDAADKSGSTPMHAAAARGLRVVIAHLHERGADLNPVDGQGLTPVHLAAQEGHLEAVKELHQRGAEIHAVVAGKGELSGMSSLDLSYVWRRCAETKPAGLYLEAQGVRAHKLPRPHQWDAGLHAAAVADCVDAIGRECAAADVNGRDRRGFSSLHLAVMHGHCNFAKALLRQGADLDAEVGGHGELAGMRAVHLACKTGQIAVLEELVELRANLDSVVAGNGVFGGYNSLDLAYAFGHKDTSLLLERCGVQAETWTRPLSFASGLHLAALRGDADRLHSSLAGGDGLDSIHPDGCTPLHLAVRAGCLASVEWLAQRGCHLDARVGKGWAAGFTAVHLAAHFGHAAVLELLLARGADAHAAVAAGGSGASMEGWTGLDVAYAAEQTAAALVLERKGARAARRTRPVGLPSGVHAAAWAGSEEWAEELCDAGARVDGPDDGGRAALHVAAGRGQVALLRLLHSRGAALEAQVAGGSGSERGMRAVHLATLAGEGEALKVLWELGADLHAKVGGGGDRAGWSCLDLAYALGRSDHLREIGSFLESQDAVALARLRPVGWETGVVLAAAALQLQPTKELVRLLGEGAAVDTRSAAGWTAVHMAAQYARTDALKVLLGRGADAKAVVDRAGARAGFQAAHIAALEGHLDVLQLLDQYGVDLHGLVAGEGEFTGCSSLDLAFACTSKHSEVANAVATFLELKGVVARARQRPSEWGVRSVLQKQLES